EHADAGQAALRRERAHDSGAGGAVAAEVALGVLADPHVVAFVPRDRNRAVEVADERVSGLDAAVEDADADALASRAAPRPFTGDALGPFLADRDLLRGVGRQAPGREVFHRRRNLL